MQKAFEALSHPVRREILALLRKRAMSAGEIAENFEIAKPTLSGHFAVLKAADLVTVERRGSTLIYRLNISVMEELVAAVLTLAEQAPNIGRVAKALVSHRKEPRNGSR